ncbi:hypothetical protein HETIRDRAFT_162764 [Heterobasidion irregulare TC 32-1]|uniref:Uncharacterized protein n=1 Tax=Heterobasidion irregulare (strain TC 32-1) TaxID=747525 RepID=W4JQZ6_HETIT|nr:uncharacterized protein HETIRDRAFT_162764 [Heterobasidion irregulare TC 32-1]ETW75992.1 hypothetical protein HETIRDRAFT_162764 [Heterobasidion irregulare TC 32-1]
MGLQDALADIFTETLPPLSLDIIDQHRTGHAVVPNSTDCATSQGNTQCGTRPTSTQSMQPAPITIDNMMLERVPSCNRSLTPSYNDLAETISVAENISPDTVTNHVKDGIAGVSVSMPALTFVMTDEASIAEQSMTAGLVPGTAISLSITEAGPVALWPL